MKKLHQIMTGFSLCIITFTSTALDLSETMDLAQQNDTTFQAAYANYLATIEASSLSTSAVLPQIGFNAFYQQGRTENDKTGTVTKSDNNSDGYSLNLDQVIFDKTIFDNLDEGDAIAAKAVADLESARQDTIVRVATAYFEATAEKIAIGQQLEQSKERFNVGLSAITDVKEQQASYDISVADEIIAINDLSNRREALRVIINVYPDNIAKPRFPLAIPEPMDIDAWQEKSLQGNFALLATQYSVDAAQSAYDGSKGGHYPTLGLNASYGVVNADERDIGLPGGVPLPASENTDARVILSLNVPIYSGGFTSSTVRQKLSQLNQAKALQEQEKRKTIALARSAYLSLEADIAQVKARNQAVISTQTSLDATLAGYDAGTRTSVDVLISQRLLYSSQRDYSVARHTYITNSLELKRVAGTLNIKDVDEINKWLMPRPPQAQ
jgi:outer membrane protein